MPDGPQGSTIEGNKLNLNFRQSALLRYGFAVMCVELATIARGQLDPILGNHAVHVTFFLAVMLSVAAGGWKPGLLAMILSELTAAYLFVPPRYTFSLGDLSQQIGTASFWLVGLSIICLGEAQRIAQQRAEAGVWRLQKEIEERRQAELARYELLVELEEEKIRLNAILQQLPVGVMIAEAPSGKVLFGNEEVSRVLNRSFHTSIELRECSDAWQAFHPDGRPYLPEEWPLTRALATGEVVENEELRLALADGTSIQVSVNAAPLEDAHCRIVAGILTLKNITARKGAEQKLVDSEARYRSLFENNSDAVFTVDLLGHFVTANPAAIKLTGYALEELNDMVFTDICAPEKREMTMRHFKLALGGSPEVLETVLITKEGRRLDLVAMGGPVVMKGETVGVFAVATDVTERKRAQAQLSAFSQLGQSLSSVSTPVEAGRIIGDVSGNLFGWDAFSLNLCSLERNEIQCVVQVDTLNGEQTEMLPSQQESGIPSGIRRILQHGAELILQTEPGGRAPDCDLFGDATHAGASLMLAPIRNKARSIGVISIRSYQPRAYDQRDLAMLQSVADYCSGALERIRAEEALRQSEEEYRTMFDLVGSGTAQLDPGTRQYVRINPKFCEITGYGAEELVGKTFMEITHPEDCAADVVRYQALMEGKIPHLRCEKRYVRKDGTLRWVDVNSTMLRDKEGRALRSLASIIDITERKQAEVALRESEQRFAAFMQHLPGIAWMKDTQGRYLYANAGNQRMIGRPLEEIYGRTDAELFPEASVRQFQEGDQTVLTTGKDLQAIEAIPGNQGERFWLVSKFPILDQEGNIVIVAGTAIDITERKQAEAALAVSNNRLSLIAQVTDTVVGTRRLQEQMGQLAEAVRTAYGVSSCVIRVLEGAELVLLANAGRREEHLPPRLPMLASFGRTVIQRHAPFTVEDGRREPLPMALAEVVPHPYSFISYAGAPLLAQDEVIGVLGIYTEQDVRKFTAADLEQLQIIANHVAVAIVNDGLFKEVNRQKQQLEEEITERREAEQEVQRLNAGLERRVQERTKQLVMANQELEAFCYSVSHDLRSPLRSIMGFAQAVAEDCEEQLAGTGQDHLQRVIQASQEMDQLIDDLLHLSRLTRSDMKLHAVELSDLARELAGNLQRDGRGRVVEFRIAPGLKAQGDGRLLRIALENLLNNAWKFTGKQAEARIEFGLERRAEGPAYFVRDNGAGFDMAYAGKLFGAFQRLHNLADFPGHGIGLATVQRVIHRHGGRTWAVGEINAGATFYFTLPSQRNNDD
ncbi:MAG: domain S-box protein [Pedosphaera sp.]|nr:domain S-box protein [Pedosphaera sp.]